MSLNERHPRSATDFKSMSIDEMRQRMRHSRAAYDLANGRLPQPVELVRVQRFGAVGYRAAVAEMQGWRASHEDAHAVAMIGEKEAAVFLVMDGHGGTEASEFCAPVLATALNGELQALEKGGMLEDEKIEAIFEDVDAQLRTDAEAKVPHLMGVPQMVFFPAGTTVVGSLVARSADGSYTVKLMNCGDSRAIILSGPEKEQTLATEVCIQQPRHLKSPESFQPPLLLKTVDHKPDHPTEKLRIQAAGGFVSEGGVPRVDGLAVSRSLGDFSHKDNSLPVAEQKVSCLPDIYEITGLRSSSILVLACDGLWDVLSSEYVASFVHDKLKSAPSMDLGDLSAELVSMSMESRDNITAMIIQLVDGAVGKHEQDEMKYFDKIDVDLESLSAQQKEDLGFVAEAGEIGEAIRKQYSDFLIRANFPAKPTPCALCGAWTQNCISCSCKAVTYCGERCQHRHWDRHMRSCTALTVVRRACCEDLILKQFKRFDKNDDGRIDRVELGSVLSSLDPLMWDSRRLDALLESCDTDEDGCLSYAEFVTWACLAYKSDDPVANAFHSILKAPDWQVLKPVLFFEHFMECPPLPADRAPMHRAWIIIFIGIDGVLNTAVEAKAFKDGVLDAAKTIQDITGTCRGGLNRTCMQLLRLLLQSFTQSGGEVSSPRLEPESSNLRLVLISTSRLDDPHIQFLRWAFAEAGIDPEFIAGCTSSLAMAGTAAEIMHFLAECAWTGRHVSGWVAIDGASVSLEGLEKPYCVQTSGIEGLVADDVSKAWTTLVAQDRSWHDAKGLHTLAYNKLDLSGHARKKGVAKASAAGNAQGRRNASNASRRAPQPAAKRAPSPATKRAPSPRGPTRKSSSPGQS